MSLFSQVKRTFKEAALVITADMDDEMKVLGTIYNKHARAVRFLTTKKTVYHDRLAGF